MTGDDGPPGAPGRPGWEGPSGPVGERGPPVSVKSFFKKRKKKNLTNVLQFFPL